MSTPPRPSKEEVASAIQSIAARRVKIDDRSRDRLPDAPDSEPREVLRYLASHSGNNIPHKVRKADVQDAIVLINFLWWEHRRLELHFLEAGIATDYYLAQLGGMVGVKSKQGTRDRIDRLKALLRFDRGRPDEKIMRGLRRKDRQAAAGTQRQTPEFAWLTAKLPELTSVIEGLDTEASRHGLTDNERSWLDELVLDVREQHVTRETITMLGLATADLRLADAVLALSSQRPHRIHELLRRADALRSDFAGLGSQSG